MRALGLIGGMSWHSTINYYRLINEQVAAELGGHASAPLVLSSVDFATIRDCQVREDWELAGRLLAREAQRLEAAGVAAIAICTNLMHKVAPAVEAATTLPLLHIVDAIAARAASQDVSSVGLVATKWVMSETFYTERLASHGIQTHVPELTTQYELDNIIWSELTRGVVTERSRERYRTAMASLVEAGAGAIVLSCTEIELLIGDADASVPVIDSMRTHATYLADFVLERTTIPAAMHNA